MNAESRIDQLHGHVNDGFDDIELENCRLSSLNRPPGPDCLPTIDEKSQITKELVPPVSFIALFRFATHFDIFLISLGVVAAIGAGMCFPFMTINFSLATQTMIYAGVNSLSANPLECFNVTFENGTSGQNFGSLHNEMIKPTINMLIVALSYFLLAVTFVACLNTATENQVIRIRSAFFKGILRQDIAWHDRNSSNDFASRITGDLNKIQDAIGEKIGMFLTCVSSYFTALIIAFLHGWLFTLVMLIFAPLMSLSIAIASNAQSSLAKRELKAYADSGAVAEEVLANIRTVVAFDGQEKETHRFQAHVQLAKKAAIRRGLATACIAAIAQGFPLLTYSLGLWYGSKLVRDENSGYSPSDVLIVFFCALGGSSMMGTIAPFLETFAVAQAAAATIYRVIDRIPQIDINALKGFVPKSLSGRISFQKVHFSYPSRPEVPVLNGITFDVFPGQTVAIVGESGCGKSTCVHLIQRFYDAKRGYIALDGQKVQDLSVNWLRSQIGVVSQEPALFGVSIADNIRYGREDVTQVEIEKAAKEANAYEFIQRLPNKFRTVVNDHDLSAGQKQRIAIARALVRNPKILLLDEATSALDGHSELVVQKALDKARKERTVIIVAHRLSTIRNADRIIVIKDGVVVEEGSHERLLAKRGAYYELSVAQQQRTSDQLNTLTIEDEEEKAKEWLYDDDDFLEATTPYGSVSRRYKPTLNISSEPETVDAKVRIIDLLRLNKQEYRYIIAGVIASIFVGLYAPIVAVLLGEMLTVFVPDCLGNEDKRQTADFNALLFLISAFILALCALIQSFCFSVAGEGLTCRMRDLTFQAIMKRDIAWFDENRTGALCARLSGDAAAVQGGTGQRLGLLFQSLSTLVASVVLSFYFEWKLGLVSSVIAPLLFAIAYFQGTIIKKKSAIDHDEQKQSVSIASEAIRNIRTVTSLGQQKLFHKMYVERLRRPHRLALKNAWIRGIICGLANGLPMTAYITTMYYGSTLLPSGLAFESVLKVSHSLTNGMQAIGQSFAFAPNYYAAKAAAARIISLIVREQPKKAKRRDEILGIATGDVDLDRVHFRYPTRPEVETLRGLSFTVRAGQTVALVGPSGSGKSTCFQLIQRFYDPNLGEVRMDFLSLKDINLKSLRSQIGVVSQEPVLFNRTIRDNIAYGDNSRKIPMEEIIEAARKANIHSFVQSLPNGYDTTVGNRGAQLSGGQKQRIAIARALLRNPSVLLLDEATSSLDYENEKIVQMALDKAREGRTCITIAHRLSTVRNADHIVVIRNGKIEEQGTHDELMRIGGMYAALCSIRSSENQQASIRQQSDTVERLL